jgi:hypothetical protein
LNTWRKMVSWVPTSSFKFMNLCAEWNEITILGDSLPGCPRRSLSVTPRPWRSWRFASFGLAIAWWMLVVASVSRETWDVDEPHFKKNQQRGYF